MKKRVFYTEWAYLLGLAALALGTAFMEKAGFGVSMVVAPAYLVYLKLSPMLPFVTFGVAEYLLQGVLLLAMILVLRRFRLSYLFSVASAVIYGLILDVSMLLVGFLPGESSLLRVVYYLVGMGQCALGVALLFHTYVTPEVYELIVKEVSARWGWDINRCKTVYDLASCAVAIGMSFAFFGWGHFEGVKLGTVLYALVNGSAIGLLSRWLERGFVFRDRWPLRGWFTGEPEKSVAERGTPGAPGGME